MPFWASRARRPARRSGAPIGDWRSPTTPIARGRPAPIPSRGSPRRTTCSPIRRRGRRTTRTCSSASAPSRRARRRRSGRPRLERLRGRVERLLAKADRQPVAAPERADRAIDRVGRRAAGGGRRAGASPECGRGGPRRDGARRAAAADPLSDLRRRGQAGRRLVPALRACRAGHRDGGGGGGDPTGGARRAGRHRDAAPGRRLAAAGAAAGRFVKNPMRILLLTPPMTQLNTPYPATAYLAGFLRLHADELGLEIAQADPALELFLRLYCRDGLSRVLAALAAARRRRRSASLREKRRPLPRDRRRRRAVSAGARSQRWRCASSAGSSCPRGRASRRSPGRSARTTAGDPLAVRLRRARRRRSRASTSPASTSTTWPTRSATGSIRASSCRATARSWPRAPPASIRWPRRSTGRRRWSTRCSTRSARELAARAPRPTSSG